MTTKEMERKALEEIKAIVNGLGKDSYIGMAFEGCFEIAEQNIDNDWGCSLQHEVLERDARIESLIAACDHAKQQRTAANKKVAELESEVNRLGGEIEEYRRALMKVMTIKEEAREAVTPVIEELQADIKDHHEAAESKVLGYSEANELRTMDMLDAIRTLKKVKQTETAVSRFYQWLTDK